MEAFFVLVIVGALVFGACMASSDSPAASKRGSVTKRYRDKERGHSYTIEFRPQGDGTWTIWALESPSNPHGGHVTDNHLYSSGQVCIAAGAEPRSLDRAIALAVYWMNRYSVFVDTGTFPKTTGRVNVE